MVGRKGGCFLHFSVYSSLPQIEAILFSKTSSVLYQNKRRFILKRSTSQTLALPWIEALKSKDLSYVETISAVF
jgi:hypothetical protein